MRPLLFAIKPGTPKLWVGTALVLLALVPTVTQADLIIGNLGADDGGNVNLNSPNFYVAASLTMGGQDYSVSNLQARFTGGVPSSLTFQIRDNASGNPSSNVLLTFDGLSSSDLATKTYTFGAGSPLTLTANSTYWLVGFATSSNANWVDSSPHTAPSGPVATFGQYKESFDAGAHWSSTSDAPKFQLNGSASVPEPSSLVLAGTAACVAAAVGLRRQQTR